MHLQPTPPTVKGPAELFTGDVHFDVIAAGELPSRLRVNLVRFAHVSDGVDAAAGLGDAR